MTPLAGLGSYNLVMLKTIFNLSDSDLNKKILVYGAGASATPGTPLVFADSFYQYALNEMEQLISAKQKALTDDFIKNSSHYLWEYFPSAEAFIEQFKSNSRQFIRQFLSKDNHKHYIYSPFPNLPFSELCFDMLLCLDTFFTNNEESVDLYFEQIKKLLTIAHELRIFPLTHNNGQIFSNIGELILKLQENSFGIELKHNHFVFEQNANAYLKIWSLTCNI